MSWTRSISRKEPRSSPGADGHNLEALAHEMQIDAEKLRAAVVAARKSMTPFGCLVTAIENGSSREYAVVRKGLGILNTPHGKLFQHVFKIDDEWGNYEAIVKSQVGPDMLTPLFNGSGALFVRPDSGCVSGQVYCDCTCECRDQLHAAIAMMSEHSDGIIVRIPAQDGRGMGGAFKLATLTLQDWFGLNTVQAANLLSDGRSIDRRTYAGVVCVLKFFGVPTTRAIALATNNPEKRRVFSENQYAIEREIRVEIPPTPLTARHLDAKRDHLGHRLKRRVA